MMTFFKYYNNILIMNLSEESTINLDSRRPRNKTETKCKS